MKFAHGMLLGSVASVGLMVLAPARAAAPVTIEKSLLGVRILQTYRDVLAKWGQPRLVVRNGETILFESALDPEGNDLGGVRSINYQGGSSSGPSGGGAPGSGGKMGGGGPSAPSMASPGGGGPSSGGGGGGGGVGGGSDSGDADTTYGASGGYGWAYHDARHQDAYTFFFNVAGRCVFIVERGREGGMPTQRGLKLGDTVKKLYELYGWPDTIQENEPGFILDYGSKYHAKFAVIKNKIVGIGVVLEESQKLPFFAPSSGGGGGGGSAMSPGSGGKMGGSRGGRMGGSAGV